MGGGLAKNGSLPRDYRFFVYVLHTNLTPNLNDLTVARDSDSCKGLSAYPCRLRDGAGLSSYNLRFLTCLISVVIGSSFRTRSRSF